MSDAQILCKCEICNFSCIFCILFCKLLILCNFAVVTYETIRLWSIHNGLQFDPSQPNAALQNIQNGANQRAQPR